MTPIYITCLHLMHGGVENVITSLANALSEKGYSVTILCTYHLGEPAYPLTSNVKIQYLTDRKPNREEFLRAIHSKRLIQIIREGMFAAWTLHLKKSTMIRAICNIQDGIIISTRNEHSVLLSKHGSASVKKIAQLHSDHKFDKKLLSDFRQRYQNIDYFVLLTPQTTEEIKNIIRGYNTHTKCVTIPNFIEPLPNHEPLPKKMQVIAAGRLHPDKNFASLLRIWAKVTARVSGFQLMIAGEGKLESALKQQAEDLGISGSVCFTGALAHDRLLSEMEQSCCYAMTSVSESFGLVLVESMMCGTAPVAFDVRVGPKAIIDSGINGFLIPDGDEQLFADKIEELLMNETLRSATEKKAMEKAKTFYKDQVLPKWIEILGQP